MNEITITLAGRELWAYLPFWTHESIKMERGHPVLFLDQPHPQHFRPTTIREGRILEYYTGHTTTVHPPPYTDTDAFDTPVLCVKVLTQEGKIRPLAAEYVKPDTRD